MNAQKKLEKVLKDNPDPTKWSKWIKMIIAILSAILGAIVENSTNVINSII